MKCKTDKCVQGRLPCPTPTRCGDYQEPNLKPEDTDFDQIDWSFVRFCALVVALGVILMTAIFLIGS